MDLLLLSAIISVLSLDITIAFQVLISSPIFACPLLGWLLGDVWLGFELGVLFQLLWLGKIPAGAYIVPEGNIASMIATVQILLNHDTLYPNTTLVIVVFITILVSYLGALFTLIYRKMNGKILNMMIKEVQRIHFVVMFLLEVGSMIFYFMSVFLFSYIILAVSLVFLPGIAATIGNLFETQFQVVKPVLIGIGLASIYPILKEAFHKKPGKSFD